MEVHGAGALHGLQNHGYGEIIDKSRSGFDSHCTSPIEF